MLNLTHEHIIFAKADCFRAGIFDVLDLTAKQVAAMAVLTDQETDELLFGARRAAEKVIWVASGYFGIA